MVRGPRRADAAPLADAKRRAVGRQPNECDFLRGRSPGATQMIGQQDTWRERWKIANARTSEG